jgi:hypothetical protein
MVCGKKNPENDDKRLTLLLIKWKDMLTRWKHKPTFIWLHCIPFRSSLNIKLNLFYNSINGFSWTCKWCWQMRYWMFSMSPMLPYYFQVFYWWLLITIYINSNFYCKYVRTVYYTRSSLAHQNVIIQEIINFGFKFSELLHCVKDLHTLMKLSFCFQNILSMVFDKITMISYVCPPYL